MCSNKPLSVRTEWDDHYTLGNSRLSLYPQPRWCPMETILRLIPVIDPIILNEVPQPNSPSRYEVFDREIQQIYTFPTEAEMHRWLESQKPD